MKLDYDQNLDQNYNVSKIKTNRGGLWKKFVNKGLCKLGE